MEEKREFIRFQLLLKGEIEVEAGTGFSSEAQMIDFSRGGLRLFVPREDFSKTSMLKLRVYLPNRHLPVVMQGGVKWIKCREGGWEIGAKLGHIHPSDKNEILEYAYNAWKEKEKTKLKIE